MTTNMLWTVLIIGVFSGLSVLAMRKGVIGRITDVFLRAFFGVFTWAYIAIIVVVVILVVLSALGLLK